MLTTTAMASTSIGTSCLWYPFPSNLEIAKSAPINTQVPKAVIAIKQISLNQGRQALFPVTSTMNLRSSRDIGKEPEAPYSPWCALVDQQRCLLTMTCSSVKGFFKVSFIQKDSVTRKLESRSDSDSLQLFHLGTGDLSSLNLSPHVHINGSNKRS